MSATRRGREIMLAARQRRLDRLALTLRTLEAEKLARLTGALDVLDEIVRGLATPVHSDQ
ncbi:MAG: hypothetical protein WDN04_03685 [Rhodospirillales bacterium]